MSDCIFCKIIAGEIPSTKIYEDEHCFGFMDLFPQSKGHCLLIPKAHSENLFEIAVEDLNHCMSAIKKLAPAVRAGLEADGVRLGQFNGAAAGQTVFHTHFHIIPCYEGIALKRHALEQADFDELSSQAERIKAALG